MQSRDTTDRMVAEEDGSPPFDTSAADRPDSSQERSIHNHNEASLRRQAISLQKCLNDLSCGWHNEPHLFSAQLFDLCPWVRNKTFFDMIRCFSSRQSNQGLRPRDSSIRLLRSMTAMLFAVVSSGDDYGMQAFLRPCAGMMREILDNHGYPFSSELLESDLTYYATCRRRSKDQKSFAFEFIWRPGLLKSLDDLTQNNGTHASLLSHMPDIDPDVDLDLVANTGTLHEWLTHLAQMECDYIRAALWGFWL